MKLDLRHYWPSGLTGLVIKAAFHSDLDVAEEAWNTWQEQCDFDEAFWGDVRIASLAYRRLGGARAAERLEPRLGGLRRYIWSTGNLRIDAARPLLQRYAESDVTFMLIKGSVLFARNPRAITDRFVADIDILVDHASWEKAVDIALQGGWYSEKNHSRETMVHRMRQTHHSLSMQRGEHGAVDLHHFSVRLNRQLGADAMTWKRATRGTLGGLPVLLPHPSDQLAIVFGHCFLYSSKRAHEWVSDTVTTISTPGFDWELFADAVIARELVVPAAAALTYLDEGLQYPVPNAVLNRVVAKVREPFLTESSANRRRYRPIDGTELNAIYRAECIRSRHFLQQSPRGPDRQNLSEAKTAFTHVPAEQKIFLALPPNVDPSERVQFRLVLEFAGLAPGTRLVLLLRCLEGLPLEVKRWALRARSGRSYTLAGELDGALIVARGIDQLWLMAANAPAGTTLTGTFAAGVSLSRREALVDRLREYLARLRSKLARSK